MGHQGSQPGLASSGVLVPPGGSGRPWALPGTNLSAGKHATHNLSQFISGKTSTTCCKISLRYQVMSSIIWLDYCRFVAKVALLGKVHEARSPQELLSLVQTNLGFIVFFSSLQRDVGVSHLFGGEIFSFWLIFFEKIKWKPTTLEFRNDHIQLCSFYCILKLFRDI